MGKYNLLKTSVSVILKATKTLTYYLLVTACLLVCLIVLMPSSTIADNNQPFQKSLSSEQEAFDRALSFLGVSDNAKPNAASDARIWTETIREDNTPFLRDSIMGRTVYHIEFNQDALNNYSKAAGKDEKLNRLLNRSLTLTIDQKSGRLMRAHSIKGDLDSAKVLPIPSDFAEEQLRGHSEIISGFPSHSPNIALLKVLNICHISPSSAVEIDILYILHTYGAVGPRPVWSITFNGIPPFQFHGHYADQVPIYARNHRRILIDDATGETIMTTTAPQPRYLPEDSARFAIPDSLLKKRDK